MIIQRSRNYIYTTAAPPALAVAIGKSIEIVQEGQELRSHLQSLIRYFQKGVSRLPFASAEARPDQFLQFSSDTPIQPVVLGDNDLAVRAAALLRNRGLLVVAIRPPTVPVNTARLRISLSAAHSRADVDVLLEAMYEVFCQLGVCQ